MISYSSVLIEFIQPILDGTEDEDEFLQKATAGMIAWNHCVSEENQLPLNEEMQLALELLISIHPEAKEILNLLTIRKALHFQEYQQFIFKVELKTYEDGGHGLRVESAPADKIERF